MYIYIYIGIGIIVTLASYVFQKYREKDISGVIKDKLNELNDDGSFSFKSANIVGYLLAFIFGVLLWPVLLIKVLKKP